jgi:hypothetical protein
LEAVGIDDLSYGILEGIKQKGKLEQKSRETNDAIGPI